MEVYAFLIIRCVSSRHLLGSFELRLAFQLVESSRGTGNMHEEGCDRTLADKLNTVAKSTLKIVEFVMATSSRITLF
jgi:hypothetical protein